MALHVSIATDASPGTSAELDRSADLCRGHVPATFKAHAYRLVDRAIALGWLRERVHVIDEDLGKSGSGEIQRAQSPDLPETLN